LALALAQAQEKSLVWYVLALHSHLRNAAQASCQAIKSAASAGHILHFLPKVILWWELLLN
jgi:hypothetical protein